MKETHVYCDLCKKPIEPWDKKAEYKMKKRVCSWESSSWLNCDVHEKCMKKFHDMCIDKLPSKEMASEPNHMIYCKDCSYYSDDGYCVLHSNYFGSYFYCGYGANIRE